MEFGCGFLFFFILSHELYKECSNKLTFGFMQGVCWVAMISCLQALEKNANLPNQNEGKWPGNDILTLLFIVLALIKVWISSYKVGKSFWVNWRFFGALFFGGVLFSLWLWGKRRLEYIPDNLFMILFMIVVFAIFACIICLIPLSYLVVFILGGTFAFYTVPWVAEVFDILPANLFENTGSSSENPLTWVFATIFSTSTEIIGYKLELKQISGKWSNFKQNPVLKEKEILTILLGAFEICFVFFGTALMGLLICVLLDKYWPKITSSARYFYQEVFEA